MSARLVAGAVLNIPGIRGKIVDAQITAQLRGVIDAIVNATDTGGAVEVRRWTSVGDETEVISNHFFRILILDTSGQHPNSIREHPLLSKIIVGWTSWSCIQALGRGSSKAFPDEVSGFSAPKRTRTWSRVECSGTLGIRIILAPI
jgi:hypothetical protein